MCHWKHQWRSDASLTKCKQLNHNTMLTDRSQHYGGVLYRIVNHSESQVRLRQISDKAGHYSINDGSRFLIRSRTCESSPWQFTITPSDLATLVDDCRETGLFGDSHLCLICGNTAICSLSLEEWSQLLDLHRKRSQAIIVRSQNGCQLNVSGSAGSLSYKIPRSRFPSNLIGVAQAA